MNSDKVEGISIENTIDEKIFIIDDDDNILYESTRKEMRKNRLGHRSVQIIIFNPETNLYTVAKRSLKKEYFPGFYEIGAGGCVTSNDTDILICSQRELKEELGIDTSLENIKFVGKMFHSDSFSRGFCYIYYIEYSGNYKFCDGEVDEVNFWTKEKILDNGKNITPDSFKCFEYYLKNNNL